MRLVLVNGEPKAPEEAVVSVYDRGFLYGDSVFETIRTYGGKPFALEEHVQRLARSASRVLIELPLPIEEIAKEIERAVELAQNPESSIRVMLTRGTGPLGLDPDLARNPSRFVFVEPLKMPPVEAYRDGIKTILVRTSRATDATAAAGAKVANYLTSLLALREAKQAQATEALIVDGNGMVVEGATSNVFVVKNGDLVTPPESAGILPGITRAHLIEVAKELGVVVRFEELPEASILDADEVFISSSIREVLPVVRVDEKTIGDGKPGAMTRKLHSAFRKAVGAPGPDPWD